MAEKKEGKKIIIKKKKKERRTQERAGLPRIVEPRVQSPREWGGHEGVQNHPGPGRVGTVTSTHPLPRQLAHPRPHICANLSLSPLSLPGRWKGWREEDSIQALPRLQPRVVGAQRAFLLNYQDRNLEGMGESR